MKKLFIITTINDLSIPLFLTQRITKLIKVKYCFFHETVKEIIENIKMQKYDFIYIRDPFTNTYNSQDIINKIENILKFSKNSYIIDNIKTIEDVFFEDKYNQYLIYGNYMPKTKILTNINDADNFKYITKRRISSRSEGIYFDSNNIDKNCLENYIIQEKLNIDIEFRVYVIFNKIYQYVSIKSSKTQDSKVKVIDIIKIPKDLLKFIKKLIVNNKFDFIGIDIAQVNNNYFVLEVNRSCLFTTFFINKHINLAEIFIKGLINK